MDSFAKADGNSLEEKAAKVSINRILSIEELPIQFLAQIFSYLHEYEKVRFEVVCKRWFYVFQLFWKVGIRMRRIPMEISIFYKDKIDRHFYNIGGGDSDEGEERSKKAFKWMILRGGSKIHIAESTDFTFFKGRNLFIDFIKNCSNLRCLILTNELYEEYPFENFLGTILQLENLKQLYIKVESWLKMPQQKMLLPGPLHSKLTHLQINNFGLNEYEFILLCQHLSNSLKYFCFKLFKLDLKSFIDGLTLLPKLINLNIENYFAANAIDSIGLLRKFADNNKMLLTDDALKALLNALPNLETLNLKYQKLLSTAGFNYLFQSPVCLKKLRYLNLVGCKFSDVRIFGHLTNRHPKSHCLQIFMNANDTWTQSVHHYIDASKCKLIFDDEDGQALFFGSDKLGTIWPFYMK